MIDPDLYERARKLDARAVEQILGALYPAVHRLAYGLTGREDAGRKVVRAIMHRGMAQIPRWRREGDAERWFLHHTVLLTRRMRAPEGDPEGDVLVRADPQVLPEHVAFVRALRKLAHQPREAIVLHDGERLEPRLLAVAMDCSMEAAANHLATGRRELLAVVGSDLNLLLARLARAYHALTPQEGLALPMLKQAARRFVWPKRLWRTVRAVATVGILIAIGYVMYRYVPILDY